MTVRRQGQVVRRLVAPGSKSEREAVVLETDEGWYILRRQGANPFEDPELETLVGKRISAEGRERGRTLLIEGWQEL